MASSTSTSTPGLNIAIIGAGIAGLSTAISLSHFASSSPVQHKITIYERSHFANEAGAAIVLAPNATRILRRWGFDFTAAGAVPNNQVRRVAADTLALDSEEQHANVEQQYGSPWLLLHRADLHNGLRALLDADSNVTIKLASEVSAVDVKAGTLTLTATGETVSKDLIVIADGAHCSHLSLFTPDGADVPVVKTPLSIYRFLLPVDAITSDPVTAPLYADQPTGFTAFYKTEIGRPGNLLQTYPCRSGKMMYCGLVHITPPDERNIIGWDQPASVEKCLAAAKGFHPALVALLGKTSDADVKVYNQMYRPCIPSFVSGKAVLVGDSAHFMLPVHGQGASVSIEDAAALGVLFANNGGNISSSSTTDQSANETLVKATLEKYQTLRHPRATATQALSNFMMAGGGKAAAEAGKYYKGSDLPPPQAKTYAREFCDFFFTYDVVREAEKVAIGESEK